MARVPRVSLGRRPPLVLVRPAGRGRRAGSGGRPASGPLAAAETSLPRRASRTAAESQYRAAAARRLAAPGQRWASAGRRLEILGAPARTKPIAEPRPRARVRAGRRVPGLEEGRSRRGAVRARSPGSARSPRPTSSSAGPSATTASSRRARAELRAALKQDPRVRRAHYYLGMVALDGEGPGRGGRGDRGVPGRARDRARRSAREPGAGRGARRSASASRKRCPRSRPPPARSRRRRARFAYLGRAQLGLGSAGARPRPRLSARAGAGRARRGRTGRRCCAIHLQLGQALQRLGRDGGGGDALRRVAAAVRRRGRTTSASSSPATWPTRPTDAAEPAADHGARRCRRRSGSALQRRVMAALARSYLNLGVLQAQGERFAPRRSCSRRRPPSTRTSRRSSRRWASPTSTPGGSTRRPGR